MCIASNGVPPTVSKRITLIVHCTYFAYIQIVLIKIHVQLWKMRERFNLLITILFLVFQFRQWFQVRVFMHFRGHVMTNILFLITVSNQLVGAYEGQQIKLECHSEAYPKSINYWTKEKGDIVPQGRRIVCLLWSGDNSYDVKFV